MGVSYGALPACLHQLFFSQKQTIAGILCGLTRGAGESTQQRYDGLGITPQHRQDIVYGDIPAHDRLPPG